MHSKCKLLWITLLLAGASTGAAASGPVEPVSPGAAKAPVIVNTACPLFEWTPVKGAKQYHLRVYRVPDTGRDQGPDDGRPALEVTVRAGESSWRPGQGGCLDVGRKYAWTITPMWERGARALASESSPRRFEVAAEAGRVPFEAEPDVAKSHQSRPVAPIRFGSIPFQPQVGRTVIMNSDSHRGIDLRAEHDGGMELWDRHESEDGSTSAIGIGVLSSSFSYLYSRFQVNNSIDEGTEFAVQGDVSGGASIANHVALFENRAGGGSADVLALQVGEVSADIGAPNNFISFKDRDGVNIGAIEGSGGGISLNTSGGDFAEYLPKTRTATGLAPGTVVGLSDGKLTIETSGAERSLVITSSPAVLGNNPMEKDLIDEHAPVAFMGQVPVKVRGPVEAGDLLVPSGENDGYAVARSIGAASLEELRSVIGRALESSSGGEAKVEATVGLPDAQPLISKLQRQEQEIEAMRERLERLERIVAESPD